MTDCATNCWELLADEDQEHLSNAWLDVEVPVSEISVWELFQKFAAESPDAIAIDGVGDQDGTISYVELAVASRQVASRLRAAGVCAGQPVGVLMARSADLVATLLGIACAGAVYVPLDLRYPLDRMRSILDRVGADLLVVDQTTREHAVTADRSTLVGVADETDMAPYEVPVAPDSLLHIIHTSGSTGQPKGVAVTHRNVVTLAADRVWAGGSDRRMLFHSPHAWDACTLEVLVPLLTGGRVVILPEDVNAVALRTLGGSGRITALWLTAGLFNALAEGDPDCFAGLREVWTGGDVVSSRAVARVQAACPHLTLYNGYGPVETTVFATRYRIPLTAGGSADVPIGTPMDNTRVYVLDERLRLLPPGAVGGIYVGGPKVASGYAGRPDLTDERFLPDPIRVDGRMYATGDLGRWDEAGNLRFAGRADGQVKINGFRIEPGEIEAVLAGHPAVSQAAVTVHKSDDGGGRIVGHAVVNGVDAPDAAALLDHLDARLPRYMLPAEVLLPAEIPLTPNGKVDRARLADTVQRPLAPAQRAMVAAPNSGDHLPTGVRLTGDLDLDALRLALADLVARHAALRTVVRQSGAEQRLQVAADVTSDLTAVRVQESQLPKVLAEIVRREFDLTTTPLRMAVLELDDQEHVVVLVLHRLVGDEALLSLACRDLAAAYLARRSGESPEWTDSAETGVARRPSGPRMSLPFDNPRPAHPTNRAGAAEFHLDDQAHAGLAALADATGAGLATVLHAGLAALFADSGKQTFRALVARLRGTVPIAEEGQVAIVVPPVLELTGTTARPEAVHIGHTGHDLAVRCQAGPGGIDGAVVFSRDVFGFDTVRGIADSLAAVLRGGAVDPDQPLGVAATTPNADAVVRVLADMWSDLLEVRVSGAEASFWELGGHSLLGVTLVARIRERFGVALRLRDLFRHPHLGELATFVESAMRPAADDPPGERAEFPASSFQHRIWLAERLRPEPGLYNVPLAWRVSGRLDAERLATALARTIDRHDALRTTFVDRGGALHQVAGPPWRPEIHQEHCADATELDDSLRAEADRPFDLATGPLLRIGLVTTPQAQHLTITVHHIVFDHASMDVLLGDLDRYYRDGDLPVASAPRYRDLIATTAPDPAAVRRRVDCLRGAPSQLPIPAPDPVQPHGIVPLKLPDDLLARMLPLQHRNGMSWFMVAAAAVAGALHQWTGSDDVTFGFPTDIRSGSGYAELIGPCLNTVAVRSRRGPDTTVAGLVEAVRDDVLAAIEDQHVPFEDVVDALKPPRTAYSTPYLEVVLAPQVRTAAQQSIGGCALTPMSRQEGTGSGGKFAVSLSLTVVGERMTGALLYRGDRLATGDAEELARLLTDMFETVLSGQDRAFGFAGRTDRAPGNPAQQRVMAIWTKVLGVEHVGLDDNFFDVGGNSLKLVTLHAELCQEFASELPVQALFENATVATMCAYLTEATNQRAEGAAPVGRGPDDRAAARRDRLRQAARR